MSNPSNTSALTSEDEVEKSPLVTQGERVGENGEEIPRLELSDATTNVNPMNIEKDPVTEENADDGAVKVRETKCMGKYEYGTKPWHLFGTR